MKKYLFVSFFCFVFVAHNVFSQPFVDVMNFSFQNFSSTYKSNSHWKNRTDNYFLNFFLPKEFKNGNTLLIRLNTESILSSISSDSSYTRQLSSASLPLGIKLVTANKKWETIIIGIPKVASDFRDKITDLDFQYGGIFLQHFVPTKKVKVKLGLYYNHEAFGDFWVPLVGIDWKASERINLYGVLPTNYRVEIMAIKNRLYTGINFKSLTRSFRLSKAENYDYVRYDELQLKAFVDCFIYKKILAFAEVGYSMGKNPWQYSYNTKAETFRNPVFTTLNSYPIINIGIAYRVRLDLEQENKDN